MPDGYDMSSGYPVPLTDTIGSGLAQDFGMGWNAGISYDFAAQGVEGLVLGAMYKSAIEMTYAGQLSTAASPFNNMIAGANAQIAQMPGMPDNFYDSIYAGDVLEQPAEFGAGVSYTMGANTFAFDYKKVKWSSAEGYSDFGWDDQNVYAFGYQYTQDNWALRAGYNYASSAVVEQAGATQMDPAFISQSANNFFNLLGFPATAERHFTLGGTYDITQAISLDLAYVYSPKTTDTFQTQAFGGSPMDPNNPGFGLASIQTSHQEDSLSFQLTFNF
jgi:long-chain fatty acid transport protein